MDSTQNMSCRLLTKENCFILNKKSHIYAYYQSFLGKKQSRLSHILVYFTPKKWTHLDSFVNIAYKSPEIFIFHFQVQIFELNLYFFLRKYKKLEPKLNFLSMNLRKFSRNIASENDKNRIYLKHLSDMKHLKCLLFWV